MRMKKDCYGCKAFYDGSLAKYCSWGYKTEQDFKGEYMEGLKPLEVCPKPRTWKEYYAEQVVWLMRI